MEKKIIRKVFWNKKNKQPSVSIPKKLIKPTIKFGDRLFVELRFLRKTEEN
jgi:hypothetical protein